LLSFFTWGAVTPSGCRWQGQGMDRDHRAGLMPWGKLPPDRLKQITAGVFDQAA